MRRSSPSRPVRLRRLALLLCLLPAGVGAQVEQGTAAEGPEGTAKDGPPAGPGPPPQLMPPPSTAQAGEMVEVAPGLRYRAGTLQRLLLGENRRPLWLRSIQVPVLDLARFGGGLTPVEPGGNQTRTLHFLGAEGREWIFRSVDKTVEPELPPDLRGTVVHYVMQDYTSALHPAGALVVAPLHEALGLLSDDPVLRVMPDDPRLGPYRETFAGMLGQMVERPNEGADGRAWRGHGLVTGTEELLQRLMEEPVHAVAAEEFLASRLLDFLVGDPDRGPDQWRWARTRREGRPVWRPIARDRDWAFIDVDGPVGRLAAMLNPKIVGFDERLPGIERLTAGDGGLDRRLLPWLERDAFLRVAAEVRERLNDEVLREAVQRLPPAMRPGHAEELLAALRARREGLPERAAEFYARLAKAPDLHGTNARDRLIVDRLPGGAVQVGFYPAIGAPPPPATAARRSGTGPRPYVARRFRPDETEEVRIYLHGGADRAMVRGAEPPEPGGIIVRIIGGSGADLLVDAAEGGATVLYDADPSDRLIGGAHTRIDRRPFDPPEQAKDWLTSEVGGAGGGAGGGDGGGDVGGSTGVLGGGGGRDWGGHASWLTPTVGYGEGAGVILGVGPTWTRYGFRHVPWKRRVALRLLYATRAETPGVDLEAEMRLENSPVSLRLDARATRFEALRFYGYGNDSPAAADHDAALVMQEEIRVRPAVSVERGGLSLAAGPLLIVTDAAPVEGGPADLLRPRGSGAFTRLGGRAALGLDRTAVADGTGRPRRGYRLEGEVRAFAPASELPEPFGRVDAEGRAYLPLPFAPGPVMAVRLGAQRAWGSFPIQEAARIGGRATLRGYRFQRFAGDAAVYGGGELRVPLMRAELIVKGRLGALALVDAGRVWLGGESPGGWHAGYGAGLWFESLGRVARLVWARGEEDRFYVGFGVPY